ncbi:TIGR04222 domain-containing membrane protein [Spirillospora sp. NPDC029432]|uniref:TIGR04222 domain-containing membrane protein n=1 Tax=Spirillospora sp. NPDC029432 TaxID=3154599 RepID=UPI003456ABD8
MERSRGVRRSTGRCSMRDDGELDHYEIAYLCGGPARVAMVALLALHRDGRLRIWAARHRLSVVRREPRDAVETAAFEAVPGKGALLGAALKEIAGSAAVREIGRRLRAEGLLPGSRLASLWQRRRVRTARAARERLAERERSASDLLRRVAATGTAGIEDTTIRRTFEIPDPKPVDLPRGRWTGSDPTHGAPSHRYGGGGYDSGGGGGSD